MLYTSVLLRVLVGKGYGVRASEYGLAHPQFRLGTLEQATFYSITQFSVCIDDIRTIMVVETPQLMHRYRVFLRWWYRFSSEIRTGRASVAEVLRTILGCCTGVNH